MGYEIEVLWISNDFYWRISGLLLSSFRKVLNSFSWTTFSTFLPRSLSSPHAQWGVSKCPGESPQDGINRSRGIKDASHPPPWRTSTQNNLRLCSGYNSLSTCFDTPPPRWCLLSDRGIIKNSFLVFDCWRSFMGYIIQVFVNFEYLFERFCLSSPGRWVAPTLSGSVSKHVLSLVEVCPGERSKNA